MPRLAADDVQLARLKDTTTVDSGIAHLQMGMSKGFK